MRERRGGSRGPETRERFGYGGRIYGSICRIVWFRRWRVGLTDVEEVGRVVIAIDGTINPIEVQSDHAAQIPNANPSSSKRLQRRVRGN